MRLLDSLNWRYATKKFDNSKKLSSEQLECLLESVNLAASSYGLQPYSLFVIDDAKVREKLCEAAYNQPQVKDASQVIVFAVNTNFSATHVDEFVERVGEVRNIAVDNLQELRNMMVGSVENKSAEARFEWAARQAYIALGFLLVTAAVKGIDACPMEGFNNKEFDKILELESKGLSSVVMATVGYRSDEDKYSKLAKVRKPIEKFVTRI